MKKPSRDQKNPPPKSANATDWTPPQRLLALHESHDLKDEALNAWCRERGLFAHDLTKWRAAFCAEPLGAGREESQELRQLRHTNQQLQRDLSRKDKALAVQRSPYRKLEKIVRPARILKSGVTSYLTFALIRMP